MKNTVLLVLLLSTCYLQAQRKPKIKGNKSVTAVSENLPSFNAIELNDELEINLQKSMDEGYVITADDNLIDVLKFKVVDSTLVISAFYKIISKKKLDITVNYRELRSITMRDGKIRMEDIITTDELHVDTFGDSKLQLNANASIVNINMEGNSFGDFNLDSDSLNITLNDKIDARVYAVSEKNTVQMYKNAGATMEGTTDTLQLNLQENTNLKAERLEAATVLATLEVASTARIYAFKNFELSSSGSSRTYLYGDPKITVLRFSDTSELYKRED